MGKGATTHCPKEWVFFWVFSPNFEMIPNQYTKWNKLGFSWTLLFHVRNFSLWCGIPMMIFPRFGFTLDLFWLYIGFAYWKKAITTLVNCGVMGDKKLGCTLHCYDYEPFLFNFSTPSFFFFTPLLVSNLPSFYPYEIITMINKLASTFTSTKTVSR